MTIEQEVKLQHLYEEHDQLTQQVSAVNGRYESLYEILKYVSQKLARNEENIKRVTLGKPMIEDDISDTEDITEYIY